MSIWWESMCGNASQDQAFWSNSLTVNTSTPDFTACFQQTVIAWTPCVILLLSSVWYLPYLYCRASVNQLNQISSFNVFKVALCLVLCLLSLSELIMNTVEAVRYGVYEPVDFVTPCVQLITYILAAFVTWYEFNKGIHSGGALFIFWGLSVIFNIVPFRSYILHLQYADGINVTAHQQVRLSLFFIRYSVQLTLFICSLFSDKKALVKYNRKRKTGERQPLLYDNNEKDILQEESIHPLETAPFWQRITLLWVTGFVIRGARKPIQFADLWQLPNDDRSEVISERASAEWQKQVHKTHFQMIKKYKADSTNSNGKIEIGGETQLLETSTQPPLHKGKSNGGKPSVWMVLVKTLGPFYCIGGFYLLVNTLLSFVNPLLLNLVISFIDTEDPYTWHGYLYITAMVLCSAMKTIFNMNYWINVNLTGLRVRTTLTGLVYRKSLRLNADARGKSTVGEIVNLMTVDAEKVKGFVPFCHQVWQAPLTIVVALYFLWQLLGPSVMAGFVLMLLVIPFNAMLAEQSRKLQIKQMLLKDQRIKSLNEVLNGIKVLKLYGWENAFRDRLIGIREQELIQIKRAQYYSAGIHVSWNISPYVVALGSFAAYTLSSPDHILDANKAFVSLSLFNILNTPISALPDVIMTGMQALVSVGRINRFLRNTELDPDNIQQHSPGPMAVSIKDGTFSWSMSMMSQQPVLKDINIDIKEGSLVAVVGKVGCGKSSLISTMLGETESFSGLLKSRGSVANVPQQAWIQNDTLQNNILFGKQLEQQRYNKVLEACALFPDLEILPGGDQVEIGENGINLSGGQKQRVSLARAVYQNSDIYLLDDPLSAVDAHVGKHIFEQVIGPTGMLKHKTRVLVTNAVTLLPHMDLIICLKEGNLSEMGSYNQLMDHAGAFAELMDTYLNETTESEVSEEDIEERKKIKRQLSKLSENTADDSPAIKKEDTPKSKSTHFKQRKGTKSVKSSDGVVTDERPTLQKDNRLTKEEALMEGRIKLSNLIAWIKTCGITASVLTMLFYLVYLGAQIGASIWLSEWSSDVPTVNGTQDIPLRNLRIGVYGGIGLVQAVGILGEALALAVATFQSSRILHHKLLRAIVRAPMSFFDTTPLGRIVNRFSKDMDILDINIPMHLRVWMGTFSTLVTTFVIVTYSTPIFLSVVIPMAVFYFFVQRFYVATTRQLKRLESVKRSPIYSHFRETLTGASSIRSFGYTERFIEKSDRVLNENLMAFYLDVWAKRWLGVMLDFVGNGTVLFAGLFIIIQRETISPAIAGLSLTYALQATGTLNIWVRMTSELEQFIVAVERIQEYTACPQEAPSTVEGNSPPINWPHRGHMEFGEYQTRYRPGLDLVLRNISFEILPQEKLGVVGRTGAGKSSISLALFRIIEAVAGKITIDGINIGKIGLHDLRSKLTVIPQDPILFSGSLRINLDPFEQYSDRDIWLALEHAHLKDYINTLPCGLQHQCTEGGDNLSVGQRQLICLARALLRKSKILVLDEATAAVDLETDDLIQKTIRSEFKGSTVITIAHRINTIMDYDRILVLDKGGIVEINKPTVLLEDKNSMFYGMACSAGLL